MKAFDVPGMAVAVVKDGQVVSGTGYGVKTLGQPAPVDERTLFGIASNTKVFTAAAIGTLVDEGKLRREQIRPAGEADHARPVAGNVDRGARPDPEPNSAGAIAAAARQVAHTIMAQCIATPSPSSWSSHSGWKSPVSAPEPTNVALKRWPSSSANAITSR